MGLPTRKGRRSKAPAANRASMRATIPNDPRPRIPGTVSHPCRALALLKPHERLEALARFLPLLVDLARRVHGSHERVRIAVLSAWGDLAGVTGWSASMLEAVEEALRH